MRPGRVRMIVDFHMGQVPRGSYSRIETPRGLVITPHTTQAAGAMWEAMNDALMERTGTEASMQFAIEADEEDPLWM